MICAIVEYKVKEGMAESEIIEMFKNAGQMFQDTPGLHKKYFCFEKGTQNALSFYLWESREAAEDLFTDELKEEFVKMSGYAPVIRYVEPVLVIDNDIEEIQYF
jgi:heme-degrading monooxygenase HmoA